MDFLLTDEQLALQETARRFALTRSPPIAAAPRPDGRVPDGRDAEGLGARACRARRCPAEYGGVGLSLFDAVLVVEELAWGCAGMATSIMCNDLGLTPIVVGGQRGPEEGMARVPDAELPHGLVLPVRARRGLRRGGAPAAGREGRRPLRAQRHEVLDHQRRRGRSLHRLRHARPPHAPPGRLRLRDAARHARHHRRQEGRQDGSARERHARDPLRQRARAGLAAPRRRGRGLQDRHAHARHHAALDRRRSRSASPAARSRRASLREGAQGLRLPDRAASRPCSSCSPTWPRTSRPRGCSPSRARG